jgi:hypothetical protein
MRSARTLALERTTTLRERASPFSAIHHFGPGGIVPRRHRAELAGGDRNAISSGKSVRVYALGRRRPRCKRGAAPVCSVGSLTLDPGSLDLALGRPAGRR